MRQCGIAPRGHFRGIVNSIAIGVGQVRVAAMEPDLVGIGQAVVVGVPDEVFGQAVVAVIVRTAPTLTEREVLRHCRARLEDFKVPQRVEFHDDLPKTSTGKVRRADIVLRGG